jgi:hypothetical protein
VNGLHEAEVVNWLGRQGVEVVEARLPAGEWGFYSLRDRLVVIDSGLTGSQRLFALLHESVHVEAKHDGHQCVRVEKRIDEQVAQIMIDLADYAWAESQYGWNTPAIALELDVPRRAVQAYRRALERAAVQNLART